MLRKKNGKTEKEKAKGENGKQRKGNRKKQVCLETHRLDQKDTFKAW